MLKGWIYQVDIRIPKFYVSNNIASKYVRQKLDRIAKKTNLELEWEIFTYFSH